VPQDWGGSKVISKESSEEEDIAGAHL